MTSKLDQAIIAYRENPTEENRAKVLELQRELALEFQLSQADEFIRRTK